MAEIYTQNTYDRNLYNDPITRVLHFSIVVLLAIDFYFTDHLIHKHVWFFYFLIAIGALYNILPYIFQGMRWLGRSFPAIVLHHFLIGALLIFYIPLDHTFVWVSLILMATAVFWMGTKGYALSLSILLPVFVLAALFQADLSFYNLAIKVTMLVIFGGLLERYTQVDRGERKQLIDFSEQAAVERERLTSLINSMVDAVIAFDADGRVELYNGATLALLNTNVTLETKSIDNILEFRDQNDHRIKLLKIAKEADTAIKRDDLHFVNNEQERVMLDISVAPIRLTYGSKEGGFICLMRDITKEKTLDEQRDEFVSVASHELRTPIAITEANISTALMPAFGKVNEKRKALLEQAHQNVLFLADLVNDLTTVARAERGDLDLEIEEVNPHDLAEKIMSDYQKQANAKGLKLSVDVAKDAPIIKSNHHRVSEILQNFVTNSLKYTKKGGIKLTAKASKDGGIEFCVTDTGIGIGSSDKNHIFSKFYRSEDYRTRESTGTGLGLYITKKLSERLHGKIWFDSKLNKGSKFYLWLPADINGAGDSSPSNSLRKK